MPDEAKKSEPPRTDRAKTLGPLPLPSDPPALVPARMVNEGLYCERLMALEWTQGEFADNAFTFEGRTVQPLFRREERRPL
jgi:hypothetical protein